MDLFECGFSRDDTASEYWTLRDQILRKILHTRCAYVDAGQPSWVNILCSKCLVWSGVSIKCNWTF